MVGAAAHAAAAERPRVLDSSELRIRDEEVVDVPRAAEAVGVREPRIIRAAPVPCRLRAGPGEEGPREEQILTQRVLERALPACVARGSTVGAQRARQVLVESAAPAEVLALVAPDLCVPVSEDDAEVLA